MCVCVWVRVKQKLNTNDDNICTNYSVGNATASGQHYKPVLEEAMKATTHNTQTMNTIMALGLYSSEYSL